LSIKVNSEDECWQMVEFGLCPLCVYGLLGTWKNPVAYKQFEMG